jgi:hypothetical protein
MGRAKERWFFSFFLFSSQVDFLVSQPPKSFILSFARYLDGVSKASSRVVARGRVARVKFGDGRPTVN